MDLKKGIEDLQSNRTFKYILGTVLSVGNFLNGAEVCKVILKVIERKGEGKRERERGKGRGIGRGKKKCEASCELIMLIRIVKYSVQHINNFTTST